MQYLLKEQWKQIEENIKESLKKNTRLILDYAGDFYYVDYIDPDDPEGFIVIAEQHAFLTGTTQELLYNYDGDEENTLILNLEIEDTETRTRTIQALLENIQTPIHYYVVAAHYWDEHKGYQAFDMKPRVEDADRILVQILPEGLMPQKSIAELIHENGQYTVKLY